jgi:hypothetical protein
MFVAHYGHDLNRPSRQTGKWVEPQMVQPAPKRAKLTIRRMRRRINSNGLTQNLLWWPSGLLCGVNPDDRADLGGHKESLNPNPNWGAPWQLLTSFPLLFARTALGRFHSLQPNTPIHLKVKDCGLWVDQDEISCVLRVGMCMDIRLQMSS